MECLHGLTIALLAADGVGQVELEASGDAVRQAGAQTQLLSLRTGHIESAGNGVGPGRTYTVDQTVAQATVDEYDALLMVPGAVSSGRLSSDDRVVSFVLDFISSGKPVGIVCYGAWTLLEAGLARGQSLPVSATVRAPRTTGASVSMGELVAPNEQLAFYGTIVKEFARLTRRPASPAEETEPEWVQSAVVAPLPPREKYCAADRLVGSQAASPVMSG